MMNIASLRCVSTYFKPRKNHSNATYMNIQQDKPPSQIDHILVSRRWASSVRSCKVKWGISMKAYGRKYDHGLVKMKFKVKLKSKKQEARKDFSSLYSPDVLKKQDEYIEENLKNKPQTESVNDHWNQLSDIMKSAQEILPTKKATANHKWNTSRRTLELVEERKENWDKLSNDERKQLNRKISRSARDDYRDYVSNILEDIEAENSAGNMTNVFKLAKSLSSQQKSNISVQPVIDSNGDQITSTEHQLECWADFLDKKFAGRPDEPSVVLEGPDEPETPKLTIDEIEESVKGLKSGKAAGPGTNRAV